MVDYAYAVFRTAEQIGVTELRDRERPAVRDWTSSKAQTGASSPILSGKVEYGDESAHRDEGNPDEQLAHSFCVQQGGCAGRVKKASRGRLYVLAAFRRVARTREHLA